ncbi:hypothetical protein [uncultured Aquimarina sp.]|uniref:hypothetical protein n=1 Tax=uncultured Aquimarina sp. TaxID=575652 RepID=UPI00260C6A00|nr:hypothetical protein [uncultured Aquimarina sp.]
MGISFATFYDFTILITSYLDIIESELQHRLSHKYVWYRKQNDLWDRQSNFIYSSVKWEDLVLKISETVSRFKIDKNDFFYYAINRWYNYWSALAVELIFTHLDEIVSTRNQRNELIDFSLFGEKFDYSTSNFPKGFKKSLEYALDYPKELVYWLCKNQSQQQRKHIENRMFVVVYAKDGDHWKLKAQISWLKDIISTYVATFDDSKLFRLQLQPYKIAKAGLIWAIK